MRLGTKQLISSVRVKPLSLLVDRSGIIHSASPGHSRWLWLGPYGLLQHPWWSLVHGHDLALALHYMRCVHRGAAGSRVWHVRVRTGGGIWCWTQITATDDW